MTFTDVETAALAPYFTNVDEPVFALVNLPETVKGALFARYSRSPKPLRRLFLDELPRQIAPPAAAGHSEVDVGAARAERLFQKVFNEYGDDSVAQLGGVHIAVEDASNVLTKVLERGRLMAYLEQSTRYIPYTERRGDALALSRACGARWPSAAGEVRVDARRRVRGLRALDRSDARRGSRPGIRRPPEDSDGVYRAAIRAKALDTLRGLLPAATQSNVGIYGTGQAFEALLLRMRAHPLDEVRSTADAMLRELRKVIPAFLTRVDQPERGNRWSAYLADVRERLAYVAGRIESATSRRWRPMKSR